MGAGDAAKTDLSELSLARQRAYQEGWARNGDSEVGEKVPAYYWGDVCQEGHTWTCFRGSANTPQGPS